MPLKSGMQPAEVRVEYDQMCVQCGYQLRGLAVTGVCPECGTAIARSFRGDRLSAADPAYVGALQTGTRRLLVGIVALLLVGAVLLAAAIIDDTVGFIPDRLANIIASVAILWPLVVIVQGVFAISARDSEGVGGHRIEIGRTAARPGAVAALGAAGGGFALDAIGVRGAVFLAVTEIIVLLGAIAALIGTWLLYSVIVRRMGDRQLGRQLRNLTALGVTTAIIYFAESLAPGRLARWLEGLGAIGLFSCLILGIGFLDAVRLGLRRDWHAARALRAPPHPASGEPVD
ncbi:MAG: hypothetical protein ACF8R7_09220 [Phycisphaerales bacterium JB039]